MNGTFDLKIHMQQRQDTINGFFEKTFLKA